MCAIKACDDCSREGGNRRGVEQLEARRLLSTVLYTVDDTSDSVTDSGSLRYALTQANALSDTDHAVIDFDFGSTGVQTIKLTSGLPAITGRVDILGPTDSQGDPLLVLDGADAGSDDDGLVFDRLASADTAASVVSGLIINNFSEQGIYISGAAPTDVYGCWIGTSATGKHSQPNGDDGIQIANNDDKIGEEGTEAYADLISGNGDVGIRIDSGAVGNTIQNCRIGTDVTGKHALGNSQGGIIDEGEQTLIGGDRPGQGNVISGNAGDGVNLDGATGCILYANLIGTNAAGTAAVGNAGDGILLQEGANDNEIGAYNSNVASSAPAFANVISGNGGTGIDCERSNSNLIASNDIGVNEAQNAAIANEGDGIDYIGSSDNTDSSNDVSGNKHNGVLIESTPTTPSALLAIVSTGNHVGDDIGISNGVAIPNGDNGVEIFKTDGNTVEQSTIENNKLAGVQINGVEATGNLLDDNEIDSNGLLGICLGTDTDTPLPNHSGTAPGPNDDQNYPVLTSAVELGRNSTVEGTLQSLPDHTYDIQFFVTGTPDPSGFGQPASFEGEMDVTTDGNGKATFTDSEVGASIGEYVSAVASDITPNVAETNDSSEASKDIAVTGASISGTVYDDANGNGKQDVGEKGRDDELVFIDIAGTGKFDQSEDLYAGTNSLGHYQITGVTPNKPVHVLVDTVPGEVQTEPSSKRPFYKVTVPAGTDVGGLDFGLEITASNSAVPVGTTENGLGATVVSDMAIKKATIARELLA